RWHTQCGSSGSLFVWPIYHCGIHDTPLHESSVSPDWRPAIGRYVTAESAANTASHLVAAPASKAHILLANDVCWILKQDRCPAPGPEHIHALHRALALAKGYSMKNGSVDLEALRLALTSHYGTDYIQSLQGQDRRIDWIAALVRPPRAHQQPIRHLALARFFGLSIEEFLTQATQVVPSDGESKPHKFRIRNDARLMRLRPHKRKAWRLALKTGKDSAREMNEALYAWLWRNDRVWLRKHRKPATKRRPDYERWTKRDRELADTVRRIADSIRGELIARVSRNAIAARSTRPSWLVRDHPYMCSATPRQPPFALARIQRTPNRFSPSNQGNPSLPAWLALVLVWRFT
ncbi:MAG: hypothetical protein QG602_1594, partial [Verrucomicrobiota bacterium]|nr:hypothetical protein [Verrucomicrobiota bacterium]